MVVPAFNKIQKDNGGKPEAMEVLVAEALLELEASSDIKSQLQELYIKKVKELEFQNRKILMIYVPMPQLKQFQKVHSRLVRELEKKFSGRHVVFLGHRRILQKRTRKSKAKSTQKRPRSRTLTSVYYALLEDLVYPAEIVGRRFRHKIDNTQVTKVLLDKVQQTNIEHKIDTFTAVYKKLTGIDVTFDFPDPIF